MIRKSSTLAWLAGAAGLMMLSASLAQSEFEKWRNQQRSEYRSYIEQRDAEFAKFLETNWIEMQSQRGIVRDPAPKPVNVPVAPPKPAPEIRPEPPAPEPERPVDIRPVQPPVPQPPPRPSLPEPPAPVTPPQVSPPVVVPPAPPARLQGRSLDLDYYGQAIKVVVDPKLAATIDGEVGNKSISRYWTAVSAADYQSVLDQLESIRTRLELNDWAYLLLSQQIAETLHPGSEKNQALLNWYLLSKAGYQARVAYGDDTVYLLLPTRQRLYDVTYISMEDTRFYGVSFDGRKRSMGRVYTYEGNYPSATRLLDLRLRQGPKTRAVIKERELKFRYQDREYRIPARYDEHTVAFLATYPQMDLEWYSEFKPRPESTETLIASLKRAIDGKSELEAANIILRFVQTAFSYATDDVQFGQENYLFAEETLYFPSSDCEDRSILFALLIRELMGLETVFVTFPGHVATAIRFREAGAINGEIYQQGDRRYVLADPTYINASVGMKMPQYKDVTGSILTLNP